VSIVGVDKIPLKYYRHKLGIEGIVERCGLPWSVLRATQFHDLVVGLLRGASRLPVMTLPAGVSCQPIATADVARRLLDVIAAPPQGRAPDIGGPRIETVQDLAQQYLRAAGKKRPLASIWTPGAVAHGYRDGRHLTPEHADGRVTFQDYLSRTISIRH